MFPTLDEPPDRHMLSWKRQPDRCDHPYGVNLSVFINELAVFDYVSNRSYVGFTKQRLVRLDPAQGPVPNGIKMRLQSTG